MSDSVRVDADEVAMQQTATAAADYSGSVQHGCLRLGDDIDEDNNNFELQQTPRYIHLCDPAPAHLSVFRGSSGFWGQWRN